MSTEVHIVAQFTAKDGSEEELEQTMRAMVPLTRAEEGCTRFELVQVRDDAATFALIERFRDQDAFDHHAQTPYVKDFLENGVPRMVGSQSVVFYSQIA